MKNKLIFIVFMFISMLFSDLLADSDLKIKIEAGIFKANIKGEVTNVANNEDIGFLEDLGYSNFNASYFSVETENNFDYLPDIYLGFFNSKESANTTLNKAITVADVTYLKDANIFSSINYNVLNFLLFEKMLIKGKANNKIFGKTIYPGDIEFRIGMSVKYIDWKYDIVDKTGISNPSWIKVDEFIPLPYLGVRYFRYKFSAYANASAISFRDAKSASFEAGVDYRFLENFHFGVGYIYEDFDVIEDNDAIYYKIDGIKLGFKYVF